MSCEVAEKGAGARFVKVGRGCSGQPRRVAVRSHALVFDPKELLSVILGKNQHCVPGKLPTRQIQGHLAVHSPLLDPRNLTQVPQNKFFLPVLYDFFPRNSLFLGKTTLKTAM
jgi:hypothetical protein